MKILCVILIFAFLLGGCSILPRLDTPTPEHGGNFAGMGNMNVDISGGDYISRDEGVLGGGGTDKPVDGTKDDIEEAPPVNDQPEIDPAIFGKWEYVDTLEFVCVLTIGNPGGLELEQFFPDENGSLSLSYRLSCPLTIEDGRIIISGDTEYDPPSLVLQPVYVEGVGDILDVVSSDGTLSSFTEYFHRVR